MDETVKQNKLFFNYQQKERESQFGKPQAWEVSHESDEDSKFFDFVIFGPIDSYDGIFDEL